MNYVLDEKARKAKEKGEKEIPKFRDWVPQGKNHEIFKVGWTFELVRCDINADGIRYLAMNSINVSYCFFSEIEVALEPHVGYIFLYNKNQAYLCPIAIHPVIAGILQELKKDFYRAWLYNKDLKFDPKNAIFDPGLILRSLERTLNPYQDFFEKAIKVYNTDPPNFLAAMMPFLTADKTKKKLAEDYLSNFESYFVQALFLTKLLQEGLGVAISKLSRVNKPLATMPLMIESYSTKLTSSPLLIIPNGDTTLVIVTTIDPGGGLPNRFYDFKATHEILKILSTRLPAKLQDS